MHRVCSAQVLNSPRSLPRVVAASSAMPVCSKCAVEKLDGQGRQRSRFTWTCKDCEALSCYLSRLDGVPDKFQNLEQQDLVDFFKQTDSFRNGSRFDLRKVCLGIEKKLVNTYVQEAGEKQENPWLPMNVWIAKGFTEAQIRRGESKDHAQLGEVWTVNLETEFASQARKQAKEECASVQLRPCGKRRREDAELDGICILEAQEDEEKETPAPKDSKKNNKELKQLERVRAKAARVELGSKTKLANKVLSSVSSVLLRAGKETSPCLDDLKKYKDKAVTFLAEQRSDVLDFTVEEFDLTLSLAKQNQKPKAKAKSANKAAKTDSVEQDSKNPETAAAKAPEASS